MLPLENIFKMAIKVTVNSFDSPGRLCGIVSFQRMMRVKGETSFFFFFFGIER